MNTPGHIVDALLEDDFDPAAEVDRLTPAWSKVRLVPHERSTVTNPSFHVWHPKAEWHLGTVQYAPMDGHGGDGNPWAGNPEGVDNDVRWFPTKDMAVRYVASFANIRESEEFDPHAEIDRVIPDLPATMTWDEGRGHWNVQTTGLAHNKWIGSVRYDPQDDVPAHANQDWKHLHWLATPVVVEAKFFKTSAEAMHYLLQVEHLVEGA